MHWTRHLDQTSRSGVAPPRPTARSSVDVHTFVSETLADHHLLVQSSSGNDALDTWLHHQGGPSPEGRRRLVVVDAIDEAAAAFYEHHGFVVAVPGNRQRLVKRVSDIAAALGKYHLIPEADKADRLRGGRTRWRAALPLRSCRSRAW